MRDLSLALALLFIAAIASSGPADAQSYVDQEHEAVLKMAFLSKRIENNEKLGNFSQAMNDYHDLLQVSRTAGVNARELYNILRRGYSCSQKLQNIAAAEFWCSETMKFCLSTWGKHNIEYARWMQTHAAIMRKVGQHTRASAEEIAAERILSAKQTSLMDASVPLTGSSMSILPRSSSGFSSPPLMLIRTRDEELSPASYRPSATSSSATDSPSFDHHAAESAYSDAARDMADRNKEHASSSPWSKYKFGK